MLWTTNRTARTLITTHLGSDAAERVLAGNIVRGRGESAQSSGVATSSAVNEAARIESLCGSLEQTVIVFSAFADAAGEARRRLVSLGRYAMKGIARPQELFTLTPRSWAIKPGFFG